MATFDASMALYTQIPLFNIAFNQKIEPPFHRKVPRVIPVT